MKNIILMATLLFGVHPWAQAQRVEKDQTTIVCVDEDQIGQWKVEVSKDKDTSNLSWVRVTFFDNAEQCEADSRHGSYCLESGGGIQISTDWRAQEDCKIGKDTQDNTTLSCSPVFHYSSISLGKNLEFAMDRYTETENGHAWVIKILKAYLGMKDYQVSRPVMFCEIQ